MSSDTAPGPSRVDEVQRFGGTSSTGRRAANDSARHARLSVLEGVAPTLLHQLAQPLAATTSYLDSCAFQVRAKIAGMEELLADIERAREQAQRAVGIIRNLRDFVLQGRMASRSEELRRIVDDALASVPEMREVDVQQRYHAAGVYVVGDRVQLVQLLANLFANAAQAMRDQKRRWVRISTADAGDDTRIRIEDGGPGLSEHVFSRLFEPFVTSKPDGSGMGLPICATIVEAHGGRLWADDPVPERGAVFNLLLPARAVLATAEAGE